MPHALVLMYHRLGDYGRFSVMQKDLGWQISNLKKRGFKFVFAEDIPSWEPSQGKVCAITFDDGYLDNLELKNIDVPVTIFMTTNPDSDEVGCDSAQFDPERLVRELSQSSNIRFGSHGVTHRKWTKLSNEELKNELTKSKMQIEEWSGQQIKVCAYPKGSTNPDVTAAVSEVYECAFLADGGAVRSKVGNNHAIPRVGIFSNTSHLMFCLRTSFIFGFLIPIWKKIRGINFGKNYRSTIQNNSLVRRSPSEAGRRRIQATVGILSFNSARTLARALESVKEFDDIIVCDGGSTDETREVALKFGARIIDQPRTGPISDFSEVRNHMLQSAKHEWFLYIDSDETASEKLVEEIRGIVQVDKSPLVYRIPQGLKYRGRSITYYSSLPGYQHRFFSRKSGAQFVKPIHERIDFPTQEVGVLRGEWFVYWDEFEKADAGSMEHLKKDAAWNIHQSFMSFVYWKLFRNLCVALYVCLYVLWARFFHRWSRCAPISAEWKKVVYKLKHVFYALKFRLKG